jgi:hypothetical protein
LLKLDLDAKISQIRINAEDIAKLKKQVKALEALRIEVVQLEEKETQHSANLLDLRTSVDENHNKFVIECENNHITSNRNKE